jgi:uncharacterized protein YqeY
MTIQERIKKDMVNAMKNKETDKVSFLRFLMGEFTRGYKKNIDDDESISILKKTLANSQQMNNDFEVSILEEYLPTMFSDDEIKTIVETIIKDNSFTSMKDMGKVMVELKNHPKSAQIDKKIANRFVREILK